MKHGVPSDESGPPKNLIQAVSAGNKAAVLSLLSSGSRATERSNNGSTALHYCARYNDREIADVLVERGAALDVKNNERRTAFDVCLEERAYDVAELLVERGCSAASITGDVVQMLAGGDEGAPGWDPVLRALARRFDRGTGSGPQLLHVALERESSKMLARLLDLGFDPNASENGYRPIHQAVMRRRREDVELLISRGADTNALLPRTARQPARSAEPRHELLTRIGERGYTPLLLAASIINDVSIVQLLLAHEADPNFVFPAG